MVKFSILLIAAAPIPKETVDRLWVESIRRILEKKALTGIELVNLQPRISSVSETRWKIEENHLYEIIIKNNKFSIRELQAINCRYIGCLKIQKIK